MNCSPSFESSTFASAAVQNAKESFIAATSLSFESVSAIFTSGAVCPEIFAQTVLFVCAMCIIRCPNEFISGDGLNTYFSAGIASAAATMFFSYRASPAFTNPLTGFATGVRSGAALAAGAAACCANALLAAINTVIPATIRPARSFITGSLSGLSVERILPDLFLGKVLQSLLNQPRGPRIRIARAVPLHREISFIPILLRDPKRPRQIHMRDLVFPIAHFRLFHVRDVVGVSKHRFDSPCRRTLLH